MLNFYYLFAFSFKYALRPNSATSESIKDWVDNFSPARGTHQTTVDLDLLDLSKLPGLTGGVLWLLFLDLGTGPTGSREPGLGLRAAGAGCAEFLVCATWGGGGQWKKPKSTPLADNTRGLTTK